MTTLTGTLYVNGDPVTGSLWLEVSQQATAAGGVVVSPSAPEVFKLVAGAITGPGAGPYTVYGNDVLTPANTFYRLTVFSEDGGQLLRGNVSITGASQDIGAWATASTQQWVPPTGYAITLIGDANGPSDANTVTKIRGKVVAAPPYTPGDVLTVQADESFAPETPAAVPGPAGVVTDETSFGLAPSVGVSTDYARADHRHGTPADPGSGGGGGISGLTPGRIPVKGATELEDSRVLQGSDGFVLRARETAADDWNGLIVSSTSPSEVTIAPEQIDGVSDTYPSLVLVANRFTGLGMLDLGTSGTTLLASGLVGSGEIAAGAGTVAVTAAAQVDGLAEITLSTSGDAEAPTSVTVNAAGVAVVTGGALTVNGDTVAPLPAGTGALWFAAAAPAGWLLCDGSAVSRTTYSALFAVMGVTYGAGDGSTTFNLPDLRQRFPLGKAASGTGNALAATGGAIDHDHTYSGTTGLRTDTGAASGGATLQQNHTHDYSGTTGANNPPFLVVHFIIKT